MKNSILTAIEAVHPSKKAARLAFDQFIEATRLALLTHGEADLPGIGRLSIKATAERQGVNPKTGEKITIAAGKRLHLRVSKTLKDQLAE